MLWGASTVVLLGLCGSLRGVYRRDSLMSLRNFYGSLRVKQDVSVEGDAMRTLMHGSIVHGTQIFSPELMRVPTTYYARESGVGLALAACCGQRGRRIGVVGLGTGTVAAYGRAGDRMRFYEINPAVEPVARNWFTYLRQTAAEVTVVGGDARASLAREAPQGFDVLVVDAFSGDAIPLHLLTVEAMGCIAGSSRREACWRSMCRTSMWILSRSLRHWRRRAAWLRGGLPARATTDEGSLRRRGSL
jgi:hypothetical protein